MNGARLLAALAAEQQASVVLESTYLGEPDYAVATVVGGTDLAQRLEMRVQFAPNTPLPANALGWPDRARAWIASPMLEALPLDRIETGVVRVGDEEELERLVGDVLRIHRGFGWRSQFAARFVDFAVSSALQHAGERAAYVAVRRWGNGIWVAVGDSGPGIPAHSPIPSVFGASTLAYWMQRLDVTGERGLGELAGLWRTCVLLHAEADFASGDELIRLSRSGETTTSYFGGAGPTLLTARV